MDTERPPPIAIHPPSNSRPESIFNLGPCVVIPFQSGLEGCNLPECAMQPHLLLNFYHKVPSIRAYGQSVSVPHAWLHVKLQERAVEIEAELKIFAR